MKKNEDTTFLNNDNLIIGSIVNVVIDRQIGTEHPKRKGVFYPINYGYIEGLIAGDGEEQDVYILGVDKPIQAFTGRVIAIIKRLNDNEDKWVAAPLDMSYTKEQIEKIVAFQECYYKTLIVM